MASEDIHEEPSEEPENEEYFEGESAATASVSYDVEVDQGDMQFEIHHNGHNSESDGVAEGLEEELPRRSTESEEEADSGAEEKADSEAEEKADSGAEDDADSGSHHEHDDPLYAGAAITVGVAMTLLLAFIVRHKLTNEAIADLLYLIDHLCPKPNRCCKTLYKFKKFFSFLVLPFNCYYYCAQCVNPISDMALRSCNICKAVINSVKDLGYFIHIPISEQIKTLFARKHFYTNLLHRFTRVKLNQDCFEDIYDGLLYKKLMLPNGILNSQNNISLTWNIDGLAVFSSSKFSLWPCYFVVNELPYQLRLLKENMIIGGLWFGEEKPNMRVFLKPIIAELATLERDGIEVQSPSIPYPFVSKVILLAGTCDLPAKCMILNTIQFNGMFGCSKCIQPGFSFSTSARGTVHVYPYCPEDPHGPARSHTQHDLDAAQALCQKTIINGVKGPSWLRKLTNYDIIDGTTIDYMHCVLLGVMRQLLSLWIGSEHHNEQYYIGRKLKVVDSRLKAINPPSMITRKPRKLSTHFKYLKASEYRAFLLYYSLPVLSGILPSQYLNHFSLLVISIHTLLQQSISHRQLLQCENMINTFCQQFEILYGRRYMSANVHLLLHLPNTVRQLGPLWVYSCFYFEGQNGILKSLVHGTQHIEKQVISSFSYFKNLSVAVDKFFSEHSNLDFDVLKHLHSNYRHKIPANSKLIASNVYALGKPLKGAIDSLLNDYEVQALQQVVNVSTVLIEVFSRIVFHNITIHSCQWNNKGIMKQNNATVAYARCGKVEYGIVEKIAITNIDDGPTTIAIIHKLDHRPLQQSCIVPHIFVCTIPSEHYDVVAVKVEDIYGPCVFMAFTDVPDTVYVAVLANLLERD